jgi:hypothetical protein
MQSVDGRVLESGGPERDGVQRQQQVRQLCVPERHLYRDGIGHLYGE